MTFPELFLISSYSYLLVRTNTIFTVQRYAAGLDHPGLEKERVIKFLKFGLIDVITNLRKCTRKPPGKIACTFPRVYTFYVRKRAKIRNRYNQAPHLTQDTNGKVTTSQLDIKNESQEVSPFPAGDRKASQKDVHKTRQK